MKKLFSIIGLAIALNLASVFAISLPVFASSSELPDLVNSQLEPIADIYGQEQADPDLLASTIAEIIRVVLGFLGVIFLILILYAGFVWMTAAGNDEKITAAKKTMVAAIIGAAIVLLAFAITSFVINNLLQATGATA
ncbi:MAG TPA: hypothetical protein VJG65_03005 [Patescibacteria group bacterium]|nr:hypothetical protein [Patescibacteria group bacterium]